MKSSVAALLAALLTTTAVAAETGLADLTSYVLVRNDTRAQVSVDQAADILKDYDVIFIGEAHEHPGNHLAEMALWFTGFGAVAGFLFWSFNSLLLLFVFKCQPRPEQTAWRAGPYKRVQISV